MVSPRLTCRLGTLLTLLVAALLVVGCASDGADRNVLPDRPEVHKTPQPEGLRDVRSTLASQRAETRDTMDATLINENELSTEDGGRTFLERIADTIGGFTSFAKFFY